MSKKITIICADENLSGAKGKWGNCIKCGDRLWVSDSTTNALLEKMDFKDVEKTDIETICMNCGLPGIIDTPRANIYPPTPEQVEEIVKGIANLKKKS